MARPKSDEKRQAIMAAAIQIIAVQGLSAPTALIAKEAGISNGSLFTYFATKAELLNQLYVDLKAEQGAASLSGLPVEGDVYEQMRHVWFQWLRWSVSQPHKRRTLAQLTVSDDITVESDQAASRAVAGIAMLLEKSRANGPMAKAPLGLVVALISGVADATLDFMIRDPANADAYCMDAFTAAWRMIT